MSERKAFPLSWPDGWKRAKVRAHAAFNKTRDARYNDQGQAVYQGKTRLSVADAVKRVFRTLVKVNHPDTGGSQEDFMKLQQAREAARTELAS